MIANIKSEVFQLAKLAAESYRDFGGGLICSCRYEELAMSKSLGDCLKGQTVFEQPTIFVSTEDLTEKSNDLAQTPSSASRSNSDLILNNSDDHKTLSSTSCSAADV